MSDYYAIVGSDVENLQHEDPESAMEGFVEDCPPNTPLPSHVMVQGYKRVQLTKDHPAFSCVLENIYEELDEELDPMGEMSNRENTSPNNVGPAFSALVDAIINDYSVWSCKEDGEPLKIAVRNEST